MADARPVVWKPRKVRRLLNLYPPLFFQRVQLRAFADDGRSCTVRLKRSLWNRNLNGSAFGGSIYAAADPFYPILYWQALAREGIAVQAWLRAAEADFRRPARSHLRLDFAIGEEQLAAARDRLQRDGYSVHTDEVSAVDEEGALCARVSCVSYLRLLGTEPGRPAAF